MRRYFRSPKDFASLFRKHFLTGVFVMIPFLAVAWIMGKIFAALWTLHLLIPEEWKPIYHFDPLVAQLLNFAITIGLTGVFAFLVSSLGWFSKRIIGVRVLAFLSTLVQRIPVVRAVFSSLNQLLKTMASGDKQQFSRVVYLEYPRKGTWALAFVTGPAKSPLGDKEKFINVYVPTTPNPTSGFHLVVPESEVRDSKMSVETAFKTILSLGLASDEAGAR
ncbi:MAG: DUF502 domain-containing protein [Bdellovibrionales bacterium]|nr:DUF502 domain-containing protein [Bdellovibrionales bacterium]